jgi:mRNA-degrading endonuclease toxin of MazEF toxin-antitoxin module
MSGRLSEHDPRESGELGMRLSCARGRKTGSVEPDRARARTTGFVRASKAQAEQVRSIDVRRLGSASEDCRRR